MISQISVEANASPARIYELARDVSRWPELLPHYRSVTVESRDGDRVTARMHAVRPGRVPLPARWTAAQWSDSASADDLQLHFRHVAGPTRGMRVVWHIRPTASGASITIEHEFSRPLPVFGTELIPFLIDRLFVRPIAGQTLATFKALAESGAS